MGGQRGSERARWIRVAVVAVPVVLAACSSGSSAVARPSTSARLQIVSPTPHQVAGPDVDLELKLMGADVVQASTGPLRPDQGHIHVFLDGKLVSMTYGTQQDLKGLSSGDHSVQAEFVATDHAPFKNRVVAAVVFEVQPPAAVAP